MGRKFIRLTERHSGEDLLIKIDIISYCMRMSEDGTQAGSLVVLNKVDEHEIPWFKVRESFDFIASILDQA